MHNWFRFSHKGHPWCPALFFLFFYLFFIAERTLVFRSPCLQLHSASSSLCDSLFNQRLLSKLNRWKFQKENVRMRSFCLFCRFGWMLLLRSSSLWVQGSGFSWLSPATTLLQITAIGRVTQHPLTFDPLVLVNLCMKAWEKTMTRKLILVLITALNVWSFIIAGALNCTC